MSDTVAYDSKYEGSGIHLQRWNRLQILDVAKKLKQSPIESLNHSKGVWGEADLASISRYGVEGKTAATGLKQRSFIHS